MNEQVTKPFFVEQSYCPDAYGFVSRMVVNPELEVYDTVEGVVATATNGREIAYGITRVIGVGLRLLNSKMVAASYLLEEMVTGRLVYACAGDILAFACREGDKMSDILRSSSDGIFWNFQPAS